MTMQVTWGNDAAAAKRQDTIPVTWDSKSAVNGHMLIVGMSGAGKTYTLKRLIAQMIETSPAGAVPRFHIFDVHGDIDIDNASSVQFSEQTNYGLNPLRVNSDPHHGGVRKCIQGFLATVNKVMRSLGPKQEAALRNILYDIFELNGFKSDDPATWHVDDSTVETIPDGRLYLDVPFASRGDAKALGCQWDGVLRSWWIQPELYAAGVTQWPPKQPMRNHPSIKDALVMAKHILLQRFLGTNQPGVIALEQANRQALGYQRKLLAALRKGDAAFRDDAMLADLEKAKSKAVDAYTEYAEAIMTGRELDDLMRYDSTDVLKSVVDRLENLDAIGIFKATKPPFDNGNPIWRYNIKALSVEERKLFVLFRLKELFESAVQSGEQSNIRDVIILDEAHIYADDDPDNIINTIAKEARKFGQALVLASQSPTHFTEDFIASVATKVVLGIDEMYWRGAATKMRVGEDALAWIRPKRNMLVQIKATGAPKNDWKWTVI